MTLVRTRWPPHPQSPDLWRRSGTSGFCCLGWKQYPPRDKEPEAFASWPECCGFVWLVHFWHGAPEQEGLSAGVAGLGTRGGGGIRIQGPMLMKEFEVSKWCHGA